MHQRLLLSALVVLLGLPLLAQQPPAQRLPDPVAAETTAIVVDVIVKDRRGRPVLDLTAADFEIVEAGAKQTIDSFRLITPDLAEFDPADPPAAQRPATPTSAGAPVLDGSTVLALVFDRLSPESRTLARDAALTYTKELRRPDDRIGVFAIDQSLAIVQPYTSDPFLVQQAIQGAGAKMGAQHASAGDRVAELAGRMQSLETQTIATQQAASVGGSAGGTAAASAGAAMGAAAAEALFAEMETRALQAAEVLERDHQGYATTNGLLAVVNSLAVLPGRKTLVLFSDGLALPPGVEPHFRAVVDMANRANVSIYTMDASGLRIDSGLEETRRELELAANLRMRELASGGSRPGSMMKTIERSEDMLRHSPHSGLGTLAQETGGFLISNTNDLRTGFRRIDEDRRFHYLLSYVPENQTFDGKYRPIEVRVRRPDVEVRARTGYHALRSVSPLPVLAYEAPALALLDGTGVPNDFPMRAAGLYFPDPGRPGLAPVLVHVRTNAFTFQPDPESQLYRTDFTILVRVSDEAGQPVSKVSQQYELTGPLARAADARENGEVLFYRAPELPPGLYTIEAIAYDGPTGKASVRIATLEVPRVGTRDLRVSNLMLVQKSEKIPEQEQGTEHPFYYGDLLLYPNMGQPFSKAAQKELSFFLAIDPGERLARPDARLQLRHHGQTLAELPVELPEPSASGRIEYTGRLPLEPLPPGSYELAMVVTAGPSETIRTAQFIVAP
jgi:VWFA-related protein